MDGTTVKKIRETLLDRREKLGVVVERERELASEDLSQEAEIIDIAQAMENMDRQASIAEQERREILAIDKALSKMSSGGFGTCEDCEEEIPAKRLMVVPEARLCAKCQAVEERVQARTMRQVAGAR